MASRFRFALADAIVSRVRKWRVTRKAPVIGVPWPIPFYVVSIEIDEADGRIDVHVSGD